MVNCSALVAVTRALLSLYEVPGNESFNNCEADPNGPVAPHYPVKIVTADKRGETVTLQNVSPDEIDLTGWWMCSILGNQQYEIMGTIAPGEIRIFFNARAPIWNNKEPTDGIHAAKDTGQGQS